MSENHDVGLLPLGAVFLAAAGYLLLAARLRGGPRGWSRWRAASFVTGCALLVVALSGPVAALAHHDFRGHMLQHLLIGMLAPLALVLGAPVTLLLRTLSVTQGRRLTALLRTRVMRVPANPVAALALSAGAMVVLYCTPLYRLATASPPLHHLLLLHFLLAGYLFSWVIAGPDPGPHRPPVPWRLVVLGVAIALHAAMAQLMYAGLAVDIPAPAGQVRGAAEIMYYGGDIAELLLAVALVATWRRSGLRRSAPARAPREEFARWDRPGADRWFAD